MTPTLPAVVRRPETAQDAAFRLDLFCRSRQPHESLPGLDPELAAQLMRQQVAGQEASYRAAYPAARHEILEVEGVPIGRLVLDEAQETWTIVDIAILDSWRGRGLGTRLLGEVMAGAREAGVSVRLRVMMHNAGAQRLYARLGFVTVAAREVDLEMVWPSPA